VVWLKWYSTCLVSTKTKEIKKEKRSGPGGEKDAGNPAREWGWSDAEGGLQLSLSSSPTLPNLTSSPLL
jgi:hypothetical protein